jgi:hypothetical protein
MMTLFVGRRRPHHVAAKKIESLELLMLGVATHIVAKDTGALRELVRSPSTEGVFVRCVCESFCIARMEIRCGVQEFVQK